MAKRSDGGSALAGFALGSLSGGISGILEPAMRVVAYSANHKLPSLLPPVSGLIHAYVTGHLDAPAFRLGCNFNGAAVLNQKGDASAARYWDSLIRAAYTQYDLADIWRLAVQGKFDPDDVLAELRHNGYSDTSAVMVRDRLLWVPPPPEVALRLWRWKVIGDDDAIQAIQESAGVQQPVARAYLDTSYLTPSPPQIIRWMAQGVDSPDVVGAAGLDSGWPGRYSDNFRLYGRRAGVSDDVMQYEWRGHYRYPPPDVIWDMVRRIRDDNAADWAAVDPAIKPLSEVQVAAALDADESAPGYRAQVQAVGYRVVSRFDIRRGVRHGLMGRPETIRRFRDLGYTEADATRVADILIYDARANKQEAAVRETVATIRKAWMLGAIDRDEVSGLLLDHGLYADEIAEFLSHLELDDKIDMLSQVVKSVKVLFLNGEWAAGVASQQLEKAGVLPDRAERMVTVWKLALLRGRRQISQQLALRLYLEGTIPRDAYVTRLTNLGFTDYDIRLLLRHADLEAAAAQEKLLEKLARQQAAREKAALAALRYSGSQAQILRWVSKSVISPEEAIARLEAIGVDPNDAARDVVAALVKPAPKPPAPPRPQAPKPGKPTPPPKPPAPVAQPKVPGQKEPPAATVAKWFRDGAIAEADLVDYLGELGYSDEDIAGYVRDALLTRKQAAGSPAAAPPPPPAPPSGGR